MLDTLCCSSRLRPQLPGPPTQGERARPWTRWLAAVRAPALKPRTPRPAPAPRHGQRDPVTPPPPEQPSHLDLCPQPQRPAAQRQSSLCCPVWGLSPHQDAPPRPRNKAGFGGRGGLARGERGLDGQTDASLSDFRNSCQLFLRFEPSAQMSRRLMCAPEIARPDGGRPRSATRKREDRTKNSQVHGRRGRAQRRPSLGKQHGGSNSGLRPAPPQPPRWGHSTFAQARPPPSGCPPTWRVLGSWSAARPSVPASAH